MSMVICKRARYEDSDLKERVFGLLEEMDGRRIGSGCKVLIKPNLLGPATPDEAILTHPLVVRHTVEYALERGAKVQLSDSPAMGTFKRVLKTSGIAAALEGLDVECRELKASRFVDVGEPFGRIELAEDVLDADVVINLPKLKTHSQMLLTLGVKNLFGCVVGLRKPEWHFRAGIERDTFAMLLVRICQRIAPTITLLDGILALEGAGPGKGGIPKHLGWLFGSSDPYALDQAVCQALGIPPLNLPTHAAAVRLGLSEQAPEIRGEHPRMSGLKLPEIGTLVFGPAWTHSLSRRHLIQRPVTEKSLCKNCGDCLRYCPAHAVSQQGKEIRFDYDRCIRCYCCVEVCPHGALRSKEPILGKVFRNLIRRSSR
ncbi:MAG: DUF362 domain-containing protein [Syntrophobacteraceae bacterium]